MQINIEVKMLKRDVNKSKSERQDQFGGEGGGGEGLSQQLDHMQTRILLPCEHATPASNTPGEPLLSDKESSDVTKSKSREAGLNN